jgi:hypothetical protein
MLARLDERVPARGRSRFILEAIEERLAIEEQLVALDEAAGAWSDENHSLAERGTEPLTAVLDNANATLLVATARALGKDSTESLQ